MASNALPPIHLAARRFMLAAMVAATACIAFPSHASMARSVADTTPQASANDAAYQRLIDATNAVVAVKVKAIPNAHSNETLGDERAGSGVIIPRDNLILTIGYLILEADTIEVTDSDGQTFPASIVAYDPATGFGLIKTLAPLSQRPIKLGTAKSISQLDRLMIVNGGAEQSVSIATVVSKRHFAGYWEYMIDDAIFTSPPRLDHSGAALINKDGELVGIGSLFVMDAVTPGERMPGNMFVPIDLLTPVIDELVRTGSQHDAKRPWLGVDSLEEDGRIKVMQVNEESPAAQAGIQPGDIILAVDGQKVTSLDNFYQKLWTRGPAGIDVPMTLLHGVDLRNVVVRTIERKQYMKQRPGI
ncbi:MAG TPA: S1C family serine protease [Usitatibacter sp.]|nr:S1C family serine protease [Usitatibacter sp.]